MPAAPVPYCYIQVTGKLLHEGDTESERAMRRVAFGGKRWCLPSPPVAHPLGWSLLSAVPSLSERRETKRAIWEGRPRVARPGVGILCRKFASLLRRPSVVGE